MNHRFPPLPSRDPGLLILSLLACLATAASAQDTDGDGIPNAWETTWHLNPNDPSDAAVDFDLDGLTSLQEYQLSLQGKGEGPIGVWTAEIVPISSAVPSATDHTNVIGLNDNDDVLIDGPGNVRVRRASDGVWGSLTLNLPNSWVYYYELIGLNDNCDVIGNVGADTGSFGFKKNPFSGGSTDVAPFHLPGQTAPVASLTGINNAGDLIGRSQSGDHFFYKASTGLVAPPSSWTGIRYHGLNNMGLASGTRDDPSSDYGAPAQIIRSATSGWTEPYPALLLDGFDPLETEPPDLVLDAIFQPRFLNDLGEFAGDYGWRIGSPEDEEKLYPGGIFLADYNDCKKLLVSGSQPYFSDHEVHGLNNHSQLLLSTKDETGENMECYLQRKGVTVPISAITPIPELGEYYNAIGNPTRINNKSTIAGITGSVPGVTGPSIYFLRPAAETDGDGIPNDWELFYGLNPMDPADANEDADGDGYTNLEEYRFGGDPNNAANHSGPASHPVVPLIDTDGDGIPDEWERLNFPTLSPPWCDPNADPDNDGLTNLMEASFNSDPNAPDTDGDGLRDDLELRANLNPRSTDSNGDGEPDSAPHGISGGPAHPTRWPDFRYFIQGAWSTTHPWWGDFMSIGDPVFKLGFVTPADKDYEFHSVIWTKVTGNNPNDPEVENVDAVESVVLKIPAGELASNEVSTYLPTPGPYKHLARADMVFLRPEEVQDAVPWGLTPFERMIPRAEAVEKGVWARINNDDDDGNLVLDSAEDSNPGENDLIEVWVSVQYLKDVIIRKPAGIRIWGDKERTDLVADTDTELVIPASTFRWYTQLWIECLEPITSGYLEFSQKDAFAKVESPISKTPIRTYTKMGVGLSGEVFSQSNPGVWNTKAATQGLFDVCRKLYLKGYNVHFYAEPHVEASGPSEGLGAVFNEIHLQTQNCSVTEVVPFGYSHGGSACYQVLNRFATGGFSTPFSVPLSGYVDAISRAGFLSEQRFPPLSASHWNMYQRNDRVLKGNTVTNAFPGTGGRDVSYLGVRHQGTIGIHHHAFVKNALETEVELKLK